jgi:cellulose biosynthesis protein BcsQ
VQPFLFVAEPIDIDKMAKEKTAQETLYPKDNKLQPEALLNQAKNIYTDGSFLGRPRGAKIDLIFGSTEIYRIIAHSGANEREYCIQNFKKFIEAASNRYDFVFVDTNPSTNIATMCALVCQFVIAPMTMDIFSVRGILMLKDIFSDRFICLREDPRQIIGISKMVASRHRHTDKLCPGRGSFSGLFILRLRTLRRARRGCGPLITALTLCS